MPNMKILIALVTMLGPVALGFPQFNYNYQQPEKGATVHGSDSGSHILPARTNQPIPFGDPSDKKGLKLDHKDTEKPKSSLPLGPSGDFVNPARFKRQASSTEAPQVTTQNAVTPIKSLLDRIKEMFQAPPKVFQNSPETETTTTGPDLTTKTISKN